MVDNFILLDEPRLPWLDPETIKAKFHALSGAAHPDRVHNAGEAEKLARLVSVDEGFLLLPRAVRRKLDRHVLASGLFQEPRYLENAGPFASSNVEPTRIEPSPSATGKVTWSSPARGPANA